MKEISEKGDLRGQVFNADENALLWEKTMPERTFTSKEKK